MKSKTDKRFIDQKEIALNFLNLVISGRFRDGLRYFSPDCRIHNPYIIGGVEDLISAMEEASRSERFETS